MSDSGELGELEELYNQGLLTDDEHRAAVRRVSAREDGATPGRRGPRLLAFWPVLALLVGIALIVFAIVGTGGGGKTKEPGIKVNGAVIVQASEHAAVPDDPNVTSGSTFGSGGFNVGQGCHTLTGLGDITSGAQVVITDGSGAVLANATLSAGVYDTGADCVFGFTSAVPKKSGYTIRIAHRDAVTFTQDEIGNPQLIL